MIKTVFDTNILIDYLLGIEQARDIIRAYENPIISRITWMEVLIGANEEEESSIKQFLDNFTITELTPNICEIAISIKKKNKIRLPDAIIWATAKSYNGMLITRNSKDFDECSPDIKIPYRI